MERRHSFGGSQGRVPCDFRPRATTVEAQGSAINFPGNPWFLPHVAFKMAQSSANMEEKKERLSHLALLFFEDGAVRLRSCEELKDVILHHFGIRKHELAVYHSSPKPFVIIFPDRRARDIVFVAGRVIDGSLELSFSEWDMDRLGDRAIIPYHVKLSIEGIPPHAWSQNLVDKILGDAVVIHHIEESTRQRYDQWVYQC
jgi:hypothetical protein